MRESTSVIECDGIVANNELRLAFPSSDEFPYSLGPHRRIDLKESTQHSQNDVVVCLPCFRFQIIKSPWRAKTLRTHIRGQDAEVVWVNVGEPAVFTEQSDCFL